MRSKRSDFHYYEYSESLNSKRLSWEKKRDKNRGNAKTKNQHFNYLVNDFAVASIVYVTVKGCPSVLWKSNKLPINTNDPVFMGGLVTLTGVLLNIVIVERA